MRPLLCRPLPEYSCGEAASVTISSFCSVTVLFFTAIDQWGQVLLHPCAVDIYGIIAGILSIRARNLPAD
jgi:hypothetical protein